MRPWTVAATRWPHRGRAFAWRRRTQRLCCALALVLTACDGDAPPDRGPAPFVAAGLDTRWLEGAGLATPAAVVHDVVADVYLVSNVDGEPLERDGNGFISRLSPDGRVRELRWIDGTLPDVDLHAPKGMAIRGDTLYVADLDCVRLFHRIAGEPAGSLCPPGATSLNGLALGADGMLYGTEGRVEVGIPSPDPDRIHAIGRSGAIEERFRGDSLGAPNGIAAGPNGVFFTTFETGGVYQVRRTEVLRVFQGRAWRLGGIAFTRDGSFALSNWSDSSVLYVEVDRERGKGQLWTLMRGISSPGHIGYDVGRHRLIIPQLDRNRLVLVELP